jgi:hypothetical protein
MMDKQFVAYWGEGYTQEVKIFTLAEMIPLYEDDPDWIESFDELQEGEVIDLSDLSGIHYVLRVK